jgi:uncharacterized protein
MIFFLCTGLLMLLNVRTYVSINGKPGVFFFSLDAGNPVAVQVARRWFHLPYYWSQMSLEKSGARIHYRSRRRDSNPKAEFEGSYHPIGPIEIAQPGSLAHWLTERYCLYTADSEGNTYCGEIAHEPWPLQPATSDIKINTMLDPQGLTLPAFQPLLHFSARQDVFVWSIEISKT